MTPPSRRWNARCCAGRGPRPGSGGLAHALETFRANRDQLHRSDPRRLIDDTELDAAAELDRPAWRPGWRRWKR